MMVPHLPITKGGLVVPPRDPGVLRFWVPTSTKFDSYRALLLAAAGRIGVKVKEM